MLLLSCFCCIGLSACRCCLTFAAVVAAVAAAAAAAPAASRFGLLTLALVLEPLRSVSSRLMRHARGIGDHCRAPRTLDFFNPRHSVLVSAMQYISTLLAGQNRRIILAERVGRYEPYSDYCAGKPEGFNNKIKEVWKGLENQCMCCITKCNDTILTMIFSSASFLIFKY